MNSEIEIERKILIVKPNVKNILEKYKGTKVNIRQTYLNCEEGGVERRVRRIKLGKQYYYVYTRKEKIEGTSLSRKEHEIEIDKKYYKELMIDRDRKLNTINKDRYTFNFKNQQIELDIYKFWRDIAIVEVEIDKESTQITLPEDMIIIKEVTKDKNYRNYSLALNKGKI